MAKKIDYSKDTSRRRGIRESLDRVDVSEAMRIPNAPTKSETKANEARLARIKAAQKAEEEARKKKIAAAKAERDARMKAEAAAMKKTKQSGASPSMLSPRRAMGISPVKNRLRLMHGGKVHRGRTAIGNKD